MQSDENRDMVKFGGLWGCPFWENYGKIYIVTKGRGNTCKPSNHKSFVYFYIRQKIVQVHFEIPRIKKILKKACIF